MQLLQRAQVASFCNEIKNQNKKIVFTNGCFDILHLGHVKYLAQARALADFLFVGLNSDVSVAQLKGVHRPVQHQQDRAEILLSLKSVDAVSIFEEATPLELIKLVKPYVLVKGGDWAPDKIVGGPFVQSLGGSVKSLPFVMGYSTSTIIEKIQKL